MSATRHRHRRSFGPELGAGAGLTGPGWRTELPLFLAASRLRATRVPWGQSWGHSERK